MVKLGRFYEDYRDFIFKIELEMHKLGVKQKDIARYGIVPGQVSNVLRGYSRPGVKFCVAAAAALSLPPEEVLNWAGLTPISDGELTEDELELLERYRNLPEPNREEARRFIEYQLAKKQDEDLDNERNDLVRRADNLSHRERLSVIAAAQSLTLVQASKRTSRTDDPPPPTAKGNQFLMS